MAATAEDKGGMGVGNSVSGRESPRSFYISPL